MGFVIITESILNISVDTKNGYLKIINNSVFTIEICAVPKKNKRKVHVEMVISPKQFLLFDKIKEFNLKDYYFRFL